MGVTIQERYDAIVAALKAEGIRVLEQSDLIPEPPYVRFDAGGTSPDGDLRFNLSIIHPYDPNKALAVQNMEVDDAVYRVMRLHAVPLGSSPTETIEIPVGNKRVTRLVSLMVWQLP